MFVDSKRTAAMKAAAITTMVLAVAAVAANAQENSQADTNEQLLACGNIADQAERMDCFNTVLEGLDRTLHRRRVLGGNQCREKVSRDRGAGP